MGQQTKGPAKLIVEDHHYESAYWAGRMIDMPDSKMAWDIAKEIATILKAEKEALKLRNDALKELVNLAGSLIELPHAYPDEKDKDIIRNAKSLIPKDKTTE